MILLESGIGNYVFSRGRKYSYFGGNNYLSLSNHPAVKVAVIEAVNKYGVNFSASRCTTGSADIHLELEKQLSAFKGKQDTVVFASGYQGNGILLEVLKGGYSTVFTDEYAHASISGGIPQGINVKFYNHCDADHLENFLRHYKTQGPLIITDGVFALTGEIAPLDKIYPLAKKYNAIMVVDDAHSTGILGKTGKGTPDHFRLPDDNRIFQTETMSKALGGYGGFISSNKRLTELIRNKSTTYQASTALPPPIVAAGLASLKIIHDNPDLHLHLLEKAGKLREEISGLGFQTTRAGTPIIPIILPESVMAKDLSVYLEKNGIIVPFINYPSKREMHLLRIAVTSDHTADQTGILLEKLTKWKKLKSKRH